MNIGLWEILAILVLVLIIYLIGKHAPAIARKKTAKPAVKSAKKAKTAKKKPKKKAVKKKTKK